MPFVSKKPKLKLSEEELKILGSASRSRTMPLRTIERAKMILGYYKVIQSLPSRGILARTARRKGKRLIKRSQMKLVITLDNHSAHTYKETDLGISIN